MQASGMDPSVWYDRREWKAYAVARWFDASHTVATWPWGCVVMLTCFPIARLGNVYRKYYGVLGNAGAMASNRAKEAGERSPFPNTSVA